MKLKGDLLKPREACLYGRQAINRGYQNETLVKYICDFAAKYKL